MNTIELSTGAKVSLVEKITWGQQEAIRATLLGGMNISTVSDKERNDLKFNAGVLLAAKYKALEVCIKEIVEADGKKHGYTQEWMDGLSIEDGDKLASTVDAITSPEKK